MIASYKNLLINLQGIYENNFNLDEFVDFYAKIKGKYKLYLISNTDLEIDLPFDGKFIGSEMGCCLPSLDIFDKALEALGCAPAECIFIDNDLKNIHAAEEVGLAPILLYGGEGKYYDTTVLSLKELEYFI